MEGAFIGELPSIKKPVFQRKRTLARAQVRSLKKRLGTLSAGGKRMKLPAGKAALQMARVGWDVDFMNLPHFCLSDSGQKYANRA
ncbi:MULTISPECIES: hypothetical protein [Simplicispira]|uniref:hypothetical protein n=1 Tax=Simplicispira TaxID=352450 RepID=UPI00104C9629|nr:MULTISPECIES: hypothetical protein [Simplicispira]MDD2692394.1 hypothetical protein [Simplicispira sp.]